MTFQITSLYSDDGINPSSMNFIYELHKQVIGHFLLTVIFFK